MATEIALNPKDAKEKGNAEEDRTQESKRDPDAEGVAAELKLVRIRDCEVRRRDGQHAVPGEEQPVERLVRASPTEDERDDGE